MKKTNQVKAALRFLHRTRIVCQLTVLFMIVASLQSFAGANAQNITVVADNKSISQVLSLIQKQSNVRFLYNSRMDALKKSVTVNYVNANLNDVLNNVFAGTNLGYVTLDNGLVVVRTAEQANRDIIVKGRVSDAAGAPVSGASVVVRGSRGGTNTDASGNFTLSVPDNTTLIISAIGFASQEIAVNGRTSIDITLVRVESKLDEVVVIGYGTASKRDLTGSIATVSGKEIADKPNTNPISSLQSKVAGLSIVNNGTPGGAPDIRIRGTASIGNVRPLYVVDGIFNDNIDYLNPNDIESIEILKDPSSLAIFGVKGANGVIAVTTKKAKSGTATITFSSTIGFKKLVDKIEMADADLFAKLFAQENANNGVANPDLSKLTANTDWIDAVTRTGKFTNNSLNVSGATDKNSFNLGLGYIYDEGIIIHERLQKMLLSFRDEFRVNKAVKVGFNFNGSRQNNPYGAGGVLDNARKVIPQISAGTKNFTVANPYGGDSITIPIYSGLATSLQNSGVVNPVLEVENTWNKQISIENRNVISLFADISFLRKFNFRSTVYGDFSTVNTRQYSPLYYAYDPINNNPYLYRQTTQVAEYDNTYRKYQQDHILTYKNKFGDHNLTATAGFTTYYFGNFNRSAVAKQYSSGNALPIPNDKRFWYINTQFNDPTATLASSDQGEYSTASGLVRLLYNYKNRYYLNGSFRRDGSSQIPTANRYQNFWAVGGAWEVSREDFMSNVKQIDNLKIKASVGVLGNQTSVDANGNALNYPSFPRLNTGISAVFGTNVYGAAQPSYIANPDLRWETINALDAGFELSAFRNRFTFEAVYFNKKTNNLMSYLSKASLGLPDELTNGGSIRNWGEEFTANWNQKINNDFSASFGGNITFLKNKVLSIAEGNVAGFFNRSFANNGTAEARTQPGLPIGAFYGYVVEGLYQSYADILASPVASALGSYRPGDFKFKDVNGDGKITADDRTFIGNPTPKFYYGANINFAYRNLSLAVDMGGVYGNQIFRTWGSLESPFQRVNYPAFKANSWTGPGTSNFDPIISQADRFNYNGSTYNIEDGSYFRLRNIQLAYTFAQTLMTKAHIKNLRVYANVQNLKTWKNNYGYTTEFGGDATAFGFDNAGGAIPVVSTLGFNLTF